MDLEAMLGTAQGDGERDPVIVNGTGGGEPVSVLTSGAAVVVQGLSAQVTSDGAEPANDSLVVNGVGGDDTIDAAALNAGQINLVINGGDGNDVITGSAGDDVVTGGRGNDGAFLGAGGDLFVWDPGAGNDVAEGPARFHTLPFNGPHVNANNHSSAQGSRR